MSLMTLGTALTPIFAFANEALLEKGGCVGCHRIEEKLVGPALREVAAKYRDDSNVAEHLFDKVRNGGEGTWGDMPMPPKAAEHFSDDELRMLINWILQLR